MNKTVLITGGTSGIGSEIALHFAKEGWNILCHYNSSDAKAKRLKLAIEDLGASCRLIKADLSSKKEITRLAGMFKSLRIDSLINNAGTYSASRPFERLTTDVLIDTFMVNTFAPTVLTSKVFSGMKTRKFGRVVNISSIAAKYGGSRNSMHYGCSKRALEGITKTVAREGAKFNVFVNTVRPGVIDTDFHKRFPKNMKKRVTMIPAKKMGDPRDIADVVYHLGSERNNFITNEIVTVAGGE